VVLFGQEQVLDLAQIRWDLVHVSEQSVVHEYVGHGDPNADQSREDDPADQHVVEIRLGDREDEQADQDQEADRGNDPEVLVGLLYTEADFLARLGCSFDHAFQSPVAGFAFLDHDLGKASEHRRIALLADLDRLAVILVAQSQHEIREEVTHVTGVSLDETPVELLDGSEEPGQNSYGDDESENGKHNALLCLG
jgi:hypothetical protein